MKLVSRLVYLFVFSITLNAFTFAQTKHAMTFDDLIGVKRVGDPQISPDGKQVAYTINVISKEQNKGKRSIWIVSTTGSDARELIASNGNNDTPRWSPDGARIAFLSTRDGAPQIYVADANGANPQKATNAPEGVGEFVWSPDGRMFAFATDVYPGDYDTPPFSLGDPTAFAFSPDAKEVCFARNTEKDESISTNNDLFIVSVDGGEAKRITEKNIGSDTTPRYSPDGRWIAYRSQARNGYESDRFRLMIYDRRSGASKEISTGFDNWVDDVVWSPDSQKIYFTTQERGREPIYVASINGGVKSLVTNTSNTDMTVSKDGKTLVFARSSLTMPAEVFKANSDGTNVVQLTKTNADLTSQLNINPAEDFDFDGALNVKVQGFIVKPPNFDASKKYPMVLLIHGGPQGAWLDNWGYRWNAQMFAARGYVAVLINPHGSTGYGQAFVEEISGDWGGAVYEDLMRGVDAVVKRGYVDETRMGAAGGSFGGYMTNWIMGHTDRFKAFVTHAGIFNTESMYATEELWFQEWEFKGKPWESDLYAKWSPHRFAKNFKTPTLVVHGELDYRVPVGEGIQLFSTLQRRGVPSKFLYFPDEGHWVLKPQNSELWYKTVLGWLDQWLKPNGAVATR
ncbi:MAG: hypothetical protein NVSMB56_04950 [Pyrinomonadaceae bacterium]